MACEELFKLMALFVQRHPLAIAKDEKKEQGDDDDEEETGISAEEEAAEINSFRTQTLQSYLGLLDGRTSWSTLIQVG